jgi:hypothetical protein
MTPRRWISAITIALVLGFLAAFPFLFPLDRFAPEIARAASAQLGEPVTVAGLRIVILPLPYASVRGIVVGADQKLRVESFDLKPDLAYLLRTLSLRWNVELVRAQVGPAAWARFAAVHSQGGEPVVQLGAVRATDSSIRFADGEVSGIEFDANFDVANQFERARVSLASGALVAEIVPHKPNYLVSVQARGWRPPLERAPLIDRLVIEGEIAGETFRLKKFEAALLDGGMTAVGEARLNQHAAQLRLELVARRLALSSIAVAAGTARKFSGQIDANLKLRGNANSLTALADALYISGEVRGEGLGITLDGDRSLRLEQFECALAGGVKSIGCSNMQGVLYGGRLTGQLRVTSRPPRKLALRFDLKGVDVAALGVAIKLRQRIAGRLSAHGEVTVDATKPAGATTAATFSFAVSDGVLGGVDLERTAKGGGESGGETKFDELRGNVSLAAGAYHVGDLRVRSGVIAAQGAVTVSQQHALDGEIDVALRGTGGLVAVPLKISGTVTEPKLAPTATAMVGAAIGTAVLGPGLGTGIGVRASRLIEEVFSSGKGKAPPPAARDVERRGR